MHSAPAKIEQLRGLDEFSGLASDVLHSEPATGEAEITFADLQRPASMQRVLVAEDEDAIRLLLSLSLEAAGFEVIEARNGVEAVALARAQNPDLVLLDMMMPVMNGLDAVARLRSEPSTAAIPVVLLTARTSDADIWAGWSAGVDYYMTKPFDIDELLRFVDYLLAVRQTADSSSAA